MSRLLALFIKNENNSYYYREPAKVPVFFSDTLHPVRSAVSAGAGGAGHAWLPGPLPRRGAFWR
jgi:hypothetical protein